MSSTYEGPVEVITKGALLQADARLLLWEGWWGGFLRMKSVAGAELAHEATARCHVTVDGSRAALVLTRRTDLGSPMLWVWGVGAAPFSSADIRRADAARKRREGG